MLLRSRFQVSRWSSTPLSGTRSDEREVRIGSWLRENVEIEFANGNFVSTSINLKNKSAGEGCRDKTIEKTILRAFRARTFSRSQGHSRQIDSGPLTSVCHDKQSCSGAVGMSQIRHDRHCRDALIQ